MGIIGVIFYFLVIFALAYGWFRLRTSDPALVWVGRIMLLLAILLVVKIVDNYVMPLRTPFEGPVHEHLPASSPTVREPGKLELKADPSAPKLDDVQAEHERRQRTFEGKTP